MLLLHIGAISVACCPQFVGCVTPGILCMPFYFSACRLATGNLQPKQRQASRIISPLMSTSSLRCPHRPGSCRLPPLSCDILFCHLSRTLPDCPPPVSSFPVCQKPFYSSLRFVDLTQGSIMAAVSGYPPLLWRWVISFSLKAIHIWSHLYIQASCCLCVCKLQPNF